MVGSGVLCFWGAISTRRWLGISAAALMVASMVDLAYFGLVPALGWAVSLLAAGLLLGFDLRYEAVAAGARGSEAAVSAGGPPGRSRSERGIAVVMAIAYPVMAWLVLTHGSGAHAALESAGAHAGHGSDVRLAAAAVALALVAAFGILAVLAGRRRRWLPALDAAGMGVMLLAMLLAHG